MWCKRCVWPTVFLLYIHTPYNFRGMLYALRACVCVCVRACAAQVLSERGLPLTGTGHHEDRNPRAVMWSVGGSSEMSNWSLSLCLITVLFLHKPRLRGEAASPLPPRFSVCGSRAPGALEFYPTFDNYNFHVHLFAPTDDPKMETVTIDWCWSEHLKWYTVPLRGVEVYFSQRIKVDFKYDLKTQSSICNKSKCVVIEVIQIKCMCCLLV